MLNNKKNIKPFVKQNIELKKINISENSKPIPASPNLHNVDNDYMSTENSPRTCQYKIQSNIQIENFINQINRQEKYIADLLRQQHELNELLNTKQDEVNELSDKKENKKNNNSKLNKLGCFSMESNIVANATSEIYDKDDEILNNWNANNNQTVRNWFNILREYKFIYQSILDKNYKNSIKYNIASIIASSALGFFSAFKLWLQDEVLFQSVSNIIMLFSNFFIAALTHIATRFIDDKRNEKIRIYIESIDNLLGVITAQLSKNSNLRMDAIDFINENNDKYTDILTNKPNLSFDELTEGKLKYKRYQNELLEVKVTTVETQTDIQINQLKNTNIHL
jgi:hypothetical protein